MGCEKIESNDINDYSRVIIISLLKYQHWGEISASVSANNRKSWRPNKI
jgi:hypothetical protein